MNTDEKMLPESVKIRGPSVAKIFAYLASSGSFFANSVPR